MGAESCGERQPRYRPYHYKRETERGLLEWLEYQPVGIFMREFNHNFNSAEELGLEEQQKESEK